MYKNRSFICGYCVKIFVVPRSEQRFCSQDCANRAKVLFTPEEAQDRQRRQRRASARRHSLKKYNLTVDAYRLILEAQGGVCAICGRRPEEATSRYESLAVDHCHSTGRVRGLLCVQCNRALGMFQDSRHVLLRAIDYLGEND